MVEVLKLLYFERKGNSSNINLAPYKEIQAAVEVLSNHQQISSTKFNLNYSELLVDMSVGLSFILNTTTFEAELNDNFIMQHLWEIIVTILLLGGIEILSSTN